MYSVLDLFFLLLSPKSSLHILSLWASPPDNVFGQACTWLTRPTSVSAASTRLLVGLRNAAFITPDQFADLGVKAAVFANSDQLHLIIGPQAQALATKMQAELRR